jgi:hypothetical protein
VGGFGFGQWSGCELVRQSGRLSSRDAVGGTRKETLWGAGVDFFPVGRKTTYTYVGRCRKPYGLDSVLQALEDGYPLSLENQPHACFGGLPQLNATQAIQNDVP